MVTAKKRHQKDLMQVSKVEEIYHIKVPLKSKKGEFFAVEAHIDSEGRVTVGNPFTNGKGKDYHFERSNPDMLEAFAQCALKVVELSAKIKKQKKNNAR